MKVKAKVRKKDLAKISKSMKCLEIGKDLTRLQASLNMLWKSLRDDPANRRETKAGARFAESEIRRFGERYPLAKNRLTSVERGLEKIASGDVTGKGAEAVVSGMRGVIYPLLAEAERSCS